MTKDNAWAGHQLTLGLLEKTERRVPEATAQKLVEVLQEILLLAGTAMLEGGAQEVDDED